MMGAQNLKVWFLAGTTVALVGAGAFAAQNNGPKPPSLTFSGPVPGKFLIAPEQGSKFGVHDHMTISADIAEQLSHSCEAFAKAHNATATVVILDTTGQIIHEHRMDGQSYLNQKAAEQKARTALLTREASHVITNRVYNDDGTLIRMQQFGLSPQQGGLPIIVNDQIIGAIGVGGGAGGEELCAQDALTKVFGPQPALLGAPRGARPTANGVFAPANGPDQGGQ
ncbi:MAG TPA: heme-binding protein [Micropepsaceae bacterium]|nr:heme-binding protein [Micropepsaceae bacterium]